MCLEKILPGKPKWRKGYKAVQMVCNQYWGDFCGLHKTRKKGVWLNEEQFRDFPQQTQIGGIFGDTYPTGWHVFKEKNKALLWAKGVGSVVVDVKCRKPLAHGFQGLFEVGVFEEIMFL